MEFIMSLRVNKTVKTEPAKKSESTEKAEHKETKVDIKFDRNKIVNDLHKRIKKFNTLKTVYTNMEEFNEALQKATSEGTYNPDAPKFIYADKKLLKGLYGLEAITGIGSIVKDDGTINTDKYKEAMKSISGDMAINVAENEFARDSEGLTKSEIKRLAEPLGIKVLNEKESEEEHQMNMQNPKPEDKNDNDYYALFD